VPPEQLLLPGRQLYSRGPSPGARVELVIWVGETKVRVDGEVAYSTLGLGIGVKFTKITDVDLQQLKQFLETLGVLARKQ